MDGSEDARRRALWNEFQQRWAAMKAGEPKEAFCQWMLGLTLADVDWLGAEVARLADEVDAISSPH